MLDPVELRYWIALGMMWGLKGKGRRLASLVEKIDSPCSLFMHGSVDCLDDAESALVSDIKSFNDWTKVDEEISLIERSDVDIITIKMEEYPDLLREIYDPPLYLYVKGDVSLLVSDVVAIVGTRRPTNYGERMSELIARGLALCGISVLSGMARGCDAFAHKGALSVNGRTIAVLGTGVDRPYPGENTRLYKSILDSGGAVISEFSMGTAPFRSNFPQRNRIISGISLGVVVVEAPQRSGALITANAALDYGREVFAIPGNVTSSMSRGTNRLIKDGASVVMDVSDIIDVLPLNIKRVSAGEETEKETPTVLEGEESRIIKVIPDDSAVTIDNIIRRSGIPIQKTLSLLLEMELKGYIRQLPGKLFMRRFVN